MSVIAAHNEGSSRGPRSVKSSRTGSTWTKRCRSCARGLPTILKKMNENLDWTQDLGDAFLADQAALLDTVQRMRQKAKDAGASEQELAETTLIAAALRAGGAMTHGTHTLE